MIKDFLKDKRVCIIGAHPDDVELGCGATLNQIKDLEVNWNVVSLASNIKDNDDIFFEYNESRELYGFDCFNTHWGLTTRGFHNEVEAIRNYVYGKYKKFDIFFTHSKYSQHLDHRVIGEAVDDICKEKTIITWEEVHSGKNIPINAWNEISSDDLTMKIHALDCYKSQSKRPYFEGDHISTLARYRGNQILKPYAEAFNIVRLVL